MSTICYLLPASLIFSVVVLGEQVQVSKLLDSLLKNYDNHLRPNYGGNPIIIDVNVMIRSMGPISESRMTYSMDCYFRQSWIDKRLAFKANKYINETLTININTMNKLWRPDTYFYNGKHSYLHTITSPNKFVRLYHDGRILYSSRLTIIAACSMDLRNFPMDIQQCPLKLGSFGYSNQDIIYRWNGEKQIAIADDMKLSQFDLIATPTSNRTDYAIIRKQKFQSTEENLFTSEYSMLEVHFHLQRHMGNFLIQIYGPCCLLVVLSWVSFWINREATADRVSLGITTFLTITFLGLESRTDLPQVPYFTALDSFLFISFAFIFASIVQFAFVHYNTKIGSGELYFMSDLQMEDNKNQEEWNRLSSKSHFIQEMNDRQKQKNYHNSYKSIRINHNNNNNNGINQFRAQLSLKRQRRCIQQLNSVSEIDKISRVVFPVLFLIINLIYWCFYLN